MNKVRRPLAYVIIYLYLLFSLFPIFWLILSSFKTHYQTLSVSSSFVFTPTVEAYTKAINGGILGAFKNSLVVAIIDVTLTLAFSMPAAYSLARYKTSVSRNIGFWLLSLRMAPAFGLVIPIYILVRDLHLLDTVIAVSLSHLLLNVPFAVWLLKGYFEEVPMEIEEAALIDGATRFQSLIYIILPLSRPMIAAVTMLTFMFSWNEFLFAFILTSSKGMTVPVLVASLAGTMNFDWPLMCAISVGAIIPAFALAAFVQKYIVRGLTLGAVK